MECLEVKERLSAWLDGELEAGEAAALTAHVEACAECRQEARAWTRLDQALAELTAPVPSGLAERVVARRCGARRPWRRSLSVAASLVLGVVLGGGLTGVVLPPPAEGPNGGEVLAFEAFQDFPQGSLGQMISYPPDEDSQA